MCSETIEQVQAALEELERRVAAADRAHSDGVAALRDDMVESVRSLRQQRERGEAAAAELRGVVHDVEAAATGKVEAVQTCLQVRMKFVTGADGTLPVTVMTQYVQAVTKHFHAVMR